MHKIILYIPRFQWPCRCINTCKTISERVVTDLVLLGVSYCLESYNKSYQAQIWPEGRVDDVVFQHAQPDQATQAVFWHDDSFFIVNTVCPPQG